MQLLCFHFVVSVLIVVKRCHPFFCPKLFPPGKESEERLVGKWNCYFYDFHDIKDLVSHAEPQRHVCNSCILPVLCIEP